MDRQLRSEIRSECREALKEMKNILMGVNEQWVTAETLSKHIEVMTPRWLKKNGALLNRTRIEWKDKDGICHQSSYLYPLHEIMQSLQDGSIKELSIL